VLLGEKESECLEVKTVMHPIWVSGTPSEKAKIELAQDVVRFTNGDVNAILVLGYREAAGGGNTVGSLTPVADSLHNIGELAVQGAPTVGAVRLLDGRGGAQSTQPG